MSMRPLTAVGIVCLVAASLVWAIGRGSTEVGGKQSPPPAVDPALVTAGSPAVGAEDLPRQPQRAEVVVRSVEVEVSRTGARIAGHVATESGNYLREGNLFVFERAPLPGEDPDKIAQFAVEVGPEGRFDTRLPISWRHPTLYVTVVSSGRVLGAAECAVSQDITIVVQDPGTPPGFWIAVHWTDYKPSRAGLLLQSRKRDSGFGESAWDPSTERTFLQLVDRRDKITGEIVLLVGELHASGRIQMMARFDFASLEDLERIADSGISVECSQTSVTVPDFFGKSVHDVRVWSSLEPAPAMAPMRIENGILRVPLAAGLTYRASGRIPHGGTVFGGVRRHESASIIEWVGSTEDDLGARIRVLSSSVAPVVGAYGTFVSRNQDRLLDGLHRSYGRSDVDGWLSVRHLMRGAYDAVVETEQFGDARRVKIRFEVPGPDRQCVIPDAFAVRLVPIGQDPAAPLDSLRGWYRARGDGHWTESTTPKWRFGQSGLTFLPHAGAYDLVLSLPPWVGRMTALVNASDEAAPIQIPMHAEATIEGRLLDDHGAPLARHVVAHAGTLEHISSLPDWARAATDDAGRFFLVLMPESNDRLLVTDPEGRDLGFVPAASGDAVVGFRKF